jgi:hypothetical protein
MRLSCHISLRATLLLCVRESQIAIHSLTFRALAVYFPLITLRHAQFISKQERGFNLPVYYFSIILWFYHVNIMQYTSDSINVTGMRCNAA